MSNHCFLPLLPLLIVTNKQPSAALNPSKLSLSIPGSWGGKAKMFFLCIKVLVGKAKLYLALGKYEGVQRGKVADTSVCVSCVLALAVYTLVHVPGLFHRVRNNNGSNYKLSKQSCAVIHRKRKRMTVKIQVRHDNSHFFPIESVQMMMFLCHRSHRASLPLSLVPFLHISFSFTFSRHLLHIPFCACVFLFAEVTGTQAPQGAPEGVLWLMASWMRSRSPGRAHLVAVGPPRVTAALEVAQVYKESANLTWLKQDLYMHLHELEFDTAVCLRWFWC